MAFSSWFLGAKPPKVTPKEQQLKEVFSGFDADEDGRLNKKELSKAFSDLGAFIPSLRARGALRSADDNNDGFIDRNEMVSLAKYAIKHGYTVH